MAAEPMAICAQVVLRLVSASRTSFSPPKTHPNVVVRGTDLAGCFDAPLEGHPSGSCPLAQNDVYCRSRRCRVTGFYVVGFGAFATGPLQYTAMSIGASGRRLWV